MRYVYAYHPKCASFKERSLVESGDEVIASLHSQPPQVHKSNHTRNVEVQKLNIIIKSVQKPVLVSPTSTGGGEIQSDDFTDAFAKFLVLALTSFSGIYHAR